MVQENNPDGGNWSLPLHKASENGSEEKVGLCLLRNQSGRIPLHMAVSNDHVDNELIHAKPEFSLALADEGQPSLNLGVANNHQLEAIKPLQKEDFLKYRNTDGNTALQLAVTERGMEIKRSLVGRPGLDVNALNKNGQTTLDVLSQTPSELCDTEIREIPCGAGEERAKDLPVSAHHHIPANHKMATSEQSSPQQQSGMKGDWEEKRVKLMVVVAILITTLTFEAARNPPKANPTSRTKTHHDVNASRSFCTISSFFMAIDAIGFLSSLSISIIIIIGGAGIRELKGMMMIAISSVIVVFSCYCASRPLAQVAVVFWFGCVSLFLVSSLVLPLGKWLFKKNGIIGEREENDVEMARRSSVRTGSSPATL